jgi:hypothetical protein
VIQVQPDLQEELDQQDTRVKLVKLDQPDSLDQPDLRVVRAQQDILEKLAQQGQQDLLVVWD